MTGQHVIVWNTDHKYLLLNGNLILKAEQTIGELNEIDAETAW